MQMSAEVTIRCEGGKLINWDIMSLTLTNNFFFICYIFTMLYMCFGTFDYTFVLVRPEVFHTL